MEVQVVFESDLEPCQCKVFSSSDKAYDYVMNESNENPTITYSTVVVIVDNTW